MSSQTNYPARIRINNNLIIVLRFIKCAQSSWTLFIKNKFLIGLDTSHVSLANLDMKSRTTAFVILLFILDYAY